MKTRLIRTQARSRNQAQTALKSSRSLAEGCPVVPATFALKLKRILVPVDFSAASKKGLKYAVHLAERLSGTICLLHVIEKASFVNDLENVTLAVPDEELESIAKKQLVSLAKKMIKSPLGVFPHTRIGKPFAEIVTLAQTQNIDLIVLATHGYTGLTHALLGSTAERVVRHAPCPVLVVRDR